MDEKEKSSSVDSRVRHIVLVRFNHDADAQGIQAAIDHFACLSDEIPGLLAFEHGTNNSPEGKNKGLDHAFFLTFESAAARDAYLPHPAHRSLSGRLRSVIDDVLVIDYTPG